MNEPSDNLPQPGKESAPLSRETFKRGLSAIRTTIDDVGGQDITVENDEMSLYDESNLEPNEVIGRQAVVTVTEGPVSYQIVLRFYNEARGKNPAYDDAAYIGIKAVEGNVEDLGQDNYQGAKITGLISFDNDAACRADLEHGTSKSDNPEAQAQFEALLAKFGLAPDIFEQQIFNYDESAMQNLADQIGTLAE